MMSQMDINNAIAQAVALLRDPRNLGELEIYRELVKQAVDRTTAARLVEFLPMVYCRLLLAQSGLQFPDTYRRLLSSGTHSDSLKLSSDNIWNSAIAFAKAEIKGGAKSQDLLAIAARSAEFEAANKLVNSGSALKDIRFTEPILMWPESGPDL